jgi:hypothetical protein
MNFIVNPSAGLLNAELAPLMLKEKALLRKLLVNLSGQEHVTILVSVVLILFAVFDVVGEVRHFVVSLKLIES